VRCFLFSGKTRLRIFERITHTEYMDYQKVHVEVEVKFLKEGGKTMIFMTKFLKFAASFT